MLRIFDDTQPLSCASTKAFHQWPPENYPNTQQTPNYIPQWHAIFPHEKSCFVPAHNGEIIQGPILWKGKFETALITLPRANAGAKAVFTSNDQNNIDIITPGKNKARVALRRLTALRKKVPGGTIALESNMPVGFGAGSSTSDILATIRLTCSLLDIPLSDYGMQRMLFEIEGAADPLALVGPDRTVIYGSRCGEVFVDDLPGLPDMLCFGFFTSATPVRTSTLIGRENYSRKEVDRFSEILQKAVTGIRSGSLQLIAQAATMSARANQCRLKTCKFYELEKIADEFPVAGISISHSGTAAALLFDPACFDVHIVGSIQKRLSKIGYFGFEIFRPCC